MNAVVTVAGRDRIGIIGGVCTRLAELGINILDIRQTVMQEYFTMMMIVDLSGAKSSYEEISCALGQYGEAGGLSIRIQRTDIFDAMHQV